jgi:predicted Abi (CAAX) family protease
LKSFSIFLNDLNDGKTLSGLTADLQELLQTVKATGRSGSLTLKVKVAPGAKPGQDIDRVTIVADRKLELPKPEAPSDFFWLTDDAEPTRQHPRQHALDLRDAKSVNAETGEITFKKVS